MCNIVCGALYHRFKIPSNIPTLQEACVFVIRIPVYLTGAHKNWSKFCHNCYLYSAVYLEILICMFAGIKLFDYSIRISKHPVDEVGIFSYDGFA